MMIYSHCEVASRGRRVAQHGLHEQVGGRARVTWGLPEPRKDSCQKINDIIRNLFGKCRIILTFIISEWELVSPHRKKEQSWLNLIKESTATEATGSGLVQTPCPTFPWSQWSATRGTSFRHSATGTNETTCRLVCWSWSAWRPKDTCWLPWIAPNAQILSTAWNLKRSI
jgi:hypothetical protein